MHNHLYIPLTNLPSVVVTTHPFGKQALFGGQVWHALNVKLESSMCLKKFFPWSSNSSSSIVPFTIRSLSAQQLAPAGMEVDHEKIIADLETLIRIRSTFVGSTHQNRDDPYPDRECAGGKDGEACLVEHEDKKCSKNFLAYNL